MNKAIIACLLGASLSLGGVTGAFANTERAITNPKTPVVQVESLPLPGAHLAAPRPVGGSRAAAKQAGCKTQGRAFKDRPDGSADAAVHVVYLLPRGAKDRRFDVDGVLTCSVLAQNQWFREQSEGLQWNLDTYSVDGKEPVDVTLVRSNLRPGQLIDVFSIEEELTRQGFAQPNKRYLVYVESDGDGACGMGASPIDVGTEPVDGQYAAVFLKSPPGCGATSFGVPGDPSYSEAIAQQELIHADGMTPIGAPHSCQLDLGFGFGHICTGPLGLTDGAEVTTLDPERIDLMFPFITLPLSEKVLDRDHDDYFRHSLPLRDLTNGIYFERV